MFLMRHLAEPRACRRCGTVFTPLYKKRKAVFCSLACQRAENLHTLDNAELSRRTAEQRGNTLRGRGTGITKYTKQGGRHLHRQVAERIIGRPLVKGEVVHHIDGVSKNNDPANLRILTQGMHASLHAKERVRKWGICTEEGCERQGVAKGLCKKHYTKAWLAKQKASTQVPG